MRKINKVIVHCSDSSFGDAAVIDKWHKSRGWDGIGYHYVILNAHPVSSAIEIHSLNGFIEVGRDIEIDGAHTRGHNHSSIGVCVIGKNGIYTSEQRESLMLLLSGLCTQFGLDPMECVFGHYEFNDKKTCPQMDMNSLRSRVSGHMTIR